MYDTVESTVQFCLQKPNVLNSTLLKNTYEVSLIQGACLIHRLLVCWLDWNVSACFQTFEHDFRKLFRVCRSSLKCLVQDFLWIVNFKDRVQQGKGLSNCLDYNYRFLLYSSVFPHCVFSVNGLLLVFNKSPGTIYGCNCFLRIFLLKAGLWVLRFDMLRYKFTSEFRPNFYSLKD